MRPRRRPEGPKPIGDLVPRVLRDLGLGEAERVMRVAACWPDAVGPEVASHCRPTALRGDVLEATVESSVWCQELQLRRPEILAALRRILGKDAPSDLWLRVG